MASRPSFHHVPQLCVRSLSRPSARVYSAPQLAAFSTTPNSRFPMPTRKSKGAAITTKGKKQLSLGGKKKKRNLTPVKKPAVGERRALKRRVVLSNTNALPIDGLKKLETTTLDDPQLQGQMVALLDATVDQLRAVEAFKTTQGWKYFRHPSMIMTKESLQLVKVIKDINDARQPQTASKVIVGQRGSGKSLALLQAMSAAFLKGWIVVNLPDAEDLVDGNSDFAPIPDSKPTQYSQKAYTANLLSQLHTANQQIFDRLKLTKDHKLGIAISGDMTLSRLCQLGAQNSDQAWPIFQAVWAEITTPSPKIPPVLFAIDGLGHIMRESEYVDPELKKIHAHDFALVSLLLSYLSGAQKLPNGGLVLAATTESNAPEVPSMNHCLQNAEARAKGQEVTAWHPYRTADPKVMAALKNVEILKMHGITKDEARTILNYYAASGMIRNLIDESYVNEKWTLSGGGNVGELERVAVKMGVARL